MITANQSESWLEDSSDFQDLPISYYNKTFMLTNLKFIFAFTYFARKSFRSEQSRANKRLIRLVPSRQLRYKINTICPLSNSCPLLRQLVVKKKKKQQNWVTPWPKQKVLRCNVPLPAWVTSKGEHTDDVKESSKAAMGMGRRKRSADLEKPQLRKPREVATAVLSYKPLRANYVQNKSHWQFASCDVDNFCCSFGLWSYNDLPKKIMVT